MNECCSAAKNILASWTFSSFLTTRRSLYVKTNSNTKTPRCESSGVPKALGLLTSKGLPVLFPALRQHCNKHTRGGFVCAHRVFTWCRAPEVYSAWRGLVSELFHVAPSCVCVSECARVCVCACVCVWKPSSHTVTCCDSSTLTEQTSQPLARSGPKPGATFELQLQQHNILSAGQRQLSVIAQRRQARRRMQYHI